MATTYLTLVNNVLNEMNEAELTSSTFSSSRGIQTAIKKFVLNRRFQCVDQTVASLRRFKKRRILKVSQSCYI